MLVWNEMEHAWECPECGALYSDCEIERAFGYKELVPENFIESYCMDCGTIWQEASM